MVYKDKTYCVSWRLCTKGGDCDRALTQDIERDARYMNLQLSLVAEPECFISNIGKKGARE